MQVGKNVLAPKYGDRILMAPSFPSLLPALAITAVSISAAACSERAAEPTPQPPLQHQIMVRLEDQNPVIKTEFPTFAIAARLAESPAGEGVSNPRCDPIRV